MVTQRIHTDLIELLASEYSLVEAIKINKEYCDNYAKKPYTELYKYNDIAFNAHLTNHFLRYVRLNYPEVRKKINNYCKKGVR